MTGSWVLVTGGSRGIGAALVTRLSRRMNVAFTWRQSEQESRALEQAGGAGWVKGFQCDGRDEQQVTGTAQALLAQYGTPAACIHNAGICQDGLHIHHTTESWNLTMDTNLNAVLFWHRVLLPAMMAQGHGAVLLMSSVTGIHGNTGQTAYAASKAAMIGMGRSLAHELGRFGIRVNSLLPGLIETDMTAAMPAHKREALRKSIPLRQFGQPDDVAQAAEFLIGEAGRYITGQTLIIDGGLTA